MIIEKSKELINKITKEEFNTKLNLNSTKNNSLNCYMRAIHNYDLKDQKLLKKLTDWRNKNMESFFTKFDATPERTKKWLENSIFKTNSQLLFLIYVENNLIGHLGFKIIDDQNFLLDNAIRGERGGPADLFIDAHKTLISWIFGTFKIDMIKGYVMSDNPSAIMMNKNVGWQEWKKLPLLLKNHNTETTWTIGKYGQRSDHNKYCYELSIKRKKFNNNEF